MRKYLIAIAALLAAATPAKAQELENLQQFRKLMQVYRYLNGLYVDEVEMEPVVEGAIRGMLEELDPHSAYLDAEEMKGVEESFDGEFSGIGVEFNVLRDTVIVVNTIAGGPAERVGVRANDRIEICAFDGQKWLRIAACAVEDDRREAKKSMLDAYPELRKMYDEDDGNTQVLYLADATATLSSFTEPPQTLSF